MSEIPENSVSDSRQPTIPLSCEICGVATGCSCNQIKFEVIYSIIKLLLRH